MPTLKITCPACKHTYEMWIKGKVNRTNLQNAYLWGCVYHLLSEHTGYTPEEVHEWCKLEFNSKMVNIGKDEIKIGLSTASLKTDEFSKYIEKIRQWASFEGLNIPDPEEYKESLTMPQG